MAEPFKIPVYAQNAFKAARLAADTNLSLRHWYYAGESPMGRIATWADVGSVMDAYHSLFYNYEGPAFAGGDDDAGPVESTE